MSKTIDDQSITFDVNDTLFFERGQGISEMLSISLDPDIIVQSYGDYVQIRGLILLQGEYQREPSETDELDSIYGTIEKVIETENNNALFSHRFPVDISVATDRVHDLNDLLVTVDSFDYKLSDRNTLKIMSAVKINGIVTEKADIKANENLITLPLQDQEEEVIDMKDEISESEKAEIEEMEEIEEVSLKVENPSEDEDEIVKNEKSRKEVETTEEQNEIEIQLNESESEDESDEVNDLQFLTELFGSQNEEHYTKIRLYITQSEDTVESIAEYYEVSTLQLIKDNNLSNEPLSDGQLLNIPVK